MLHYDGINNTLLEAFNNFLKENQITDRRQQRRGYEPQHMRMLPPLQGQEHHRYHWNRKYYRTPERNYATSLTSSTNNRRREMNTHNRYDTASCDCTCTHSRSEYENSDRRSSNTTTKSNTKQRTRLRRRSNSQSRVRKTSSKCRNTTPEDRSSKNIKQTQDKLSDIDTIDRKSKSKSMSKRSNSSSKSDSSKSSKAASRSKSSSSNSSSSSSNSKSSDSEDETKADDANIKQGKNTKNVSTKSNLSKNVNVGKSDNTPKGEDIDNEMYRETHRDRMAEQFDQRFAENMAKEQKKQKDLYLTCEQALKKFLEQLKNHEHYLADYARMNANSKLDEITGNSL